MMLACNLWACVELYIALYCVCETIVELATKAVTVRLRMSLTVMKRMLIIKRCSYLWTTADGDSDAPCPNTVHFRILFQRLETRSQCSFHKLYYIALPLRLRCCNIKMQAPHVAAVALSCYTFNDRRSMHGCCTVRARHHEHDCPVSTPFKCILYCSAVNTAIKVFGST